MSEIEWLDIFADNLVERLSDANMTQKELAEEAMLAESTISQYIHKVKTPGLRAIINIAYALDCSIEDLIDFGAMIR